MISAPWYKPGAADGRGGARRGGAGRARDPVDKALRNIKYLCVKEFPESMHKFPRATRGYPGRFPQPDGARALGFGVGPVVALRGQG